MNLKLMRLFTNEQFTELTQESTIGRGHAADIKVTHGSVSRIHARFAKSDFVWTVEDLSSLNGVILRRNNNSEPIGQGKVALTEGDVLFFGDFGVWVSFK